MQKFDNLTLIYLIEELNPEAIFFEIGEGNDKQEFLDMADNNQELIVLRNTQWKN